MKQNASPGAQFEAPRRRWRLGQDKKPGHENQDSVEEGRQEKHM